MKKGILAICVIVQLMSCTNKTINVCNFDYRHKPYNNKINFELLNDKNIYSEFPYKEFLDSASWWSLQTMDSAFTELTQNLQISDTLVLGVIRNCLVDTLLKNLNYTNLDSLELLLDVHEKFQIYADASPKLENFYLEVSDTFGLFVAKKLEELANKNNNIKSTFSFNYVVQHSRCLAFNPDIKVDNIEKIINYVGSGEYLYLWNRFWHGTSFLNKFSIIFPTLLMLSILNYGLYLIVKKHFKFKSK